MSAFQSLRSLALAATVLVGGCQHPNGTTDWGSTLLLGAGVGVAAALVAGAVSDGGPHHRGPAYGQDGRSYGGFGGGPSGFAERSARRGGGHGRL